MTRRAILLIFGMTLGKLDAVSADSPGGQLTVDLDQWAAVVFKHQGKVVTVSVAEVFAALSEERGKR